MNVIAILLVLASCVAHAGWNFVCKSKTPSAAFFTLSTCSSVAVMIPLYIYFAPFYSQVPLLLWALLIVTGFFQALYYVSLGNAYRLNDISLAYPLSRSLPVLMVPLVCFVIGYGKPLSAIAIVGMIITAAGCMILPLQVLNLSFLRGYFQYPLLFVVLTSVGTTGFSIVDSMGLEILKAGANPLPPMKAALFYIAFEDLATLLFLCPYLLFSNRERTNLRNIRRHSLRYPLLAGPVVSISYALVLLAMQFASNVSYIVAFRQVSILIGVLLGIFILKEKPTHFKLVGTVLIFIGVVLAAIA